MRGFFRDYLTPLAAVAALAVVVHDRARPAAPPPTPASDAVRDAARDFYGFQVAEFQTLADCTGPQYTVQDVGTALSVARAASERSLAAAVKAAVSPHYDASGHYTDPAAARAAYLKVKASVREGMAAAARESSR